MTCESFRTRFHVETDDAELLAHLRECDACLDHAANIDPDILFRAIGGEIVPPGGVDAFVDDVMRQVHLRDAEASLGRNRTLSWPRRLAIAATVIAGISGALLVDQVDRGPRRFAPVPRAQLRHLTTKPVVETYESANATIVEVPAENAADDVKIVMIFDENLPADL